MGSLLTQSRASCRKRSGCSNGTRNPQHQGSSRMGRSVFVPHLTHLMPSLNYKPHGRETVTSSSSPATPKASLKSISAHLKSPTPNPQALASLLAPFSKQSRAHGSGHPTGADQNWRNTSGGGRNVERSGQLGIDLTRASSRHHK